MARHASPRTKTNRFDRSCCGCCCRCCSCCCLLPAACCLLPAACCLLPAACCLLSAVCCLILLLFVCESLCVCLFVCLFDWLVACMLACLLAGWLACLFTCLFVCLSVGLSFFCLFVHCSLLFLSQPVCFRGRFGTHRVKFVEGHHGFRCIEVACLLLSWLPRFVRL